MKPEAIVYTSNTGYTAEYARMLGESTGLPVYDLNAAAAQLKPGTEILYLGWLMAGAVKGYKAAAKRYRVCAVCGVCMGATGSQLEEVRKANALPQDMPLFTLQGGFDLSRLHGVYRFMMVVMGRVVGKRLAKKADRTAEEEQMLQLFTKGGSCVSKEHLAGVLAWLAAAEPA